MNYLPLWTRAKAKRAKAKVPKTILFILMFGGFTQVE
jgi:hypothetical protein